MHRPASQLLSKILTGRARRTAEHWTTCPGTTRHTHVYADLAAGGMSWARSARPRGSAEQGRPREPSLIAGRLTPTGLRPLRARRDGPPQREHSWDRMPFRPPGRRVHHGSSDIVSPYDGPQTMLRAFVANPKPHEVHVMFGRGEATGEVKTHVTRSRCWIG